MGARAARAEVGAGAVLRRQNADAPAERTTFGLIALQLARAFASEARVAIRISAAGDGAPRRRFGRALVEALVADHPFSAGQQFRRAAADRRRAQGARCRG